MLFAHLKRILRLGRSRLRGPNGAKDEFLLAANAQMANSNTASSNKISLSADIVAAYVSRNSVTPVGLPALIEAVHGAPSKLGAMEAVPKTEALLPAVPIRKSITPSVLICLDDGKKLKTLKRHLTNLGMTPDQDRAKWGLPDSYPMVATEYAATRSTLAKKSGFGQTRSIACIMIPRLRARATRALRIVDRWAIACGHKGERGRLADAWDGHQPTAGR
jgi:predicted transcriptional regulator